MKNNLVLLYNAIKNDYSIQRYTFQGTNILIKIEAKYKKIELDNDVQFSNKILYDAIETTTGKIREMLLIFSRELSINLETLRNK